jgi:hypothetical protein
MPGSTVGGAFRNRPTVFRNLPPDYDLERGFGSGTGEALNERLDDTGFIEGGLGCQVNDLLRVDATGGYRFRSSLVDGNDTLRTELETVMVFANAYWDITNYGGFTPYVGGGAGAAFHRLSNITAPLDASDGDTTAFAWNATAGVSYDITPELKIDVSYRYTVLDSLASPAARCHLGWTRPPTRWDRPSATFLATAGLWWAAQGRNVNASVALAMRCTITGNRSWGGRFPAGKIRTRVSLKQCRGIVIAAAWLGQWRARLWRPMPTILGA